MIYATVVTLLAGLMIYELRPNQTQQLFEVSSMDPWTGGSEAGFYIDLQGNVYTIDIAPETKFEMAIAARYDGPGAKAPYITSDLSQYSRTSRQLAGKIDPTPLGRMIGLIQPSSAGELSSDDPLTPGTCYSRDAGTVSYRAYLYNVDFKSRTAVELYSMGDFKRVNLSRDGRLLYEWLESVCTEHNYFSGCNPPPRICKP